MLVDVGDSSIGMLAECFLSIPGYVGEEDGSHRVSVVASGVG